MPIFNTAVMVVANVPAEDEADAIRKLTAALDAAGFYAESVKSTMPTPDAFEAEDGTEPDPEFAWSPPRPGIAF